MTNITQKPQLASNLSTSSPTITTEQSQKLIQTMLTMSFGCIAFLRGLFPDEMFVDQRFVPAKFERGYKADDPPKNKFDSLRVKTLVRGKSANVDLLLNWIDKGCVDAIRKGYLKSLVFGIFLDEKNPTELQEVYTFNFDYKINKISINLNQDNSASGITLLSSRKTLQALMKRFIVITQSLDLLPDKKFLTMRLLFNEDCPPDYQPPKFLDASKEQLATIKVMPECVIMNNVGLLKTGGYGIQINQLSALEDCAKGQLIDLDPFDLPIVGFPNSKRSSRIPPRVSKSVDQECRQSEASQITKELRQFLEKEEPTSSTQFPETQTLPPFDCECGSRSEIKGCSTLTCYECATKLHTYCYDEYISDKVLCYKCRSEAMTNRTLHDNLKLLLNARKLYHILRKVSFVPSSVKLIHRLAGFEDESELENTLLVFKIFIEKGLVYLTEEPLKNKNKSIIKGSGWITFDCNWSGITFSDTHQTISSNSKIGFTFIQNLRSVPKGLTQQFTELKAKANEFKTFLFQTTKSKYFSIDNALNHLTMDDAAIMEDTLDSSEFSSPTKERKSEADFSRVNIGSSQDSIIDSPSMIASEAGVLNSLKRQHNTETTIKDSLEFLGDGLKLHDDIYTSQPVVSFPKLSKKQKITH